MFSKLSLTIVVIFSLSLGLSLKAHPTTYASIGDFVWVDQNGNGIQDSGEPGVANVTVSLINASGSVVATTTTNSSGIYHFTNVYVPSPAQFKVQFGTPGQYTWTTKLAPGSTVTNNSNADANGLSDAFTVTQGDNNTCIDAGIRQSTSGKASVGDFVFVDQNANGKQDAGEPGVANVTVKLLDASGAVVATTATNSSGIYMFSNFSISACGQYKVQFGTPGQYTWTAKQASGSTVTNNSNADANGLTDAFSVCPGDYNTCIDAGILQSATGNATIGDFVFIDQNLNGRQDAGEQGVANVSVKLLNAAGAVVATATTNSSGIYFLYLNLSTCGQYRVQFGTPGKYTFTTKQAPGSTVTNNSNADANGLTDSFSVCPGDYNTCIDAGIVPSGGPLASSFQFKGLYSNGVSQLTWTTVTETSPIVYEVERSADGVAFKSITSNSINSKGSSNGSTYTFNDNLPLSGSNYYRLKMTEAGNVNYSNTVLINVTVKGINITGVYPNPFINRIKLSVVSENAAPINIIVSDYLGRTIKSVSVKGQKGSNEVFVDDLGSLGKGIYNINVITGGQTKSIKLMKD